LVLRFSLLGESRAHIITCTGTKVCFVVVFPWLGSGRKNGSSFPLRLYSLGGKTLRKSVFVCLFDGS